MSKELDALISATKMVSAELVGGLQATDNIYRVEIKASAGEVTPDLKESFKKAVGNVEFLANTWSVKKNADNAMGGMPYTWTGHVRKHPEKANIPGANLKAFHEEFKQKFGGMVTMSQEEITASDIEKKTVNMFMDKKDGNIWNLSYNEDGSATITKEDTLKAFTEVLSSANTNSPTGGAKSVIEADDHGKMVAYVHLNKKTKEATIKCGVTVGAIEDPMKDKMAVLYEIVSESSPNHVVSSFDEVVDGERKYTAKQDIISKNQIIESYDINFEASDHESMGPALKNLFDNPTPANRLTAYVKLFEIHPEAASKMREHITKNAVNMG